VSRCGRGTPVSSYRNSRVECPTHEHPAPTGRSMEPRSSSRSRQRRRTAAMPAGRRCTGAMTKPVSRRGIVPGGSSPAHLQFWWKPASTTSRSEYQGHAGAGMYSLLQALIDSSLSLHWPLCGEVDATDRAMGPLGAMEYLIPVVPLRSARHVQHRTRRFGRSVNMAFIPDPIRMRRR
jgi:hypothetical protein